jgi:hypothetical protein
MLIPPLQQRNDPQEAADPCCLAGARRRPRRPLRPATPEGGRRKGAQERHQARALGMAARTPRGRRLQEDREGLLDRRRTESQRLLFHPLAAVHRGQDGLQYEAKG